MISGKRKESKQLRRVKNYKYREVPNPIKFLAKKDQEVTPGETIKQYLPVEIP